MLEPLPHILLIHPRMERVAGGNGVTVWIAETLLDAGYQVTLATLTEAALESHDHAFGTSLSTRSELRLRMPPPAWQSFMRAWPTSGAEIEAALLERWATELWKEGGFDLIVCGHNEVRLPVRGLQYLHYPRHRTNRPDDDVRWIHRLPLAMATYHALVRSVGGRLPENWGTHRTLANSGFIAEFAHEAGFQDVTVVHPPVVSSPSPIPWADREERFIVIGRLHRAKGVHNLVDIFQVLRTAGHEFEAVLIGPWDCDPAYRQEIQTAIDRSDWLTHRDDLGRAQLQDLLHRSRWGIHRMQGEHFGMGVAEMVRAGMVVFAHDSGGPREILREDARLLYQDDADGVRKIGQVLNHPELALELHRAAVARAPDFHMDHFRSAILSEVEAALHSGATA